MGVWGGLSGDVTDRVDALGSQLAAPPHIGQAFLVLEAITPSELSDAADAGVTHALVTANWDQLQTAEDGAVDPSSVLTKISDAQDAGLEICLEVGLQYPPTFVTTDGVKLKDQDDNEWSADQGSGEDIRDWVWDGTTRGYVADFLDKLFAALDWRDIERVRLGGLNAGELAFPASSGTAREFWGYSTPAQSGTGIAAGMAPCPVDSHTISATPTWTADDRTFVTWYNQSIVNWMQWLIAKHREWFAGPIWVMHPSAGLRPVSQVPTSESQGDNYRQNVAEGLDWDKQIAGYPDAGVWPYSTWADSDHFWTPDPYNETADGNAAPWFHLLRVARKYGRAGRIGGENTGSQSNTDMDRMFEDGAGAFGFEFLGWFNHDSLATGTDDTYANLTTQIGRY